MSSTNQTPHYGLPEFVPTDKPAWLVDWNGAMSDIDTAIYTAESKADAAAAAAQSATGDITNLESSVASIQSQVTAATEGVVHAQGDINTINSLIGSGEPTTQDKTIIGAINELAAEIPSGGDVAAEDVTYDNTASGLTATDVQAAIDELHAEIGVDSESEFKRQFANKKILVFGDSLSVDDTTWVESLKTLASECGATVDNQSASGRTSAGGLTAVADLTTAYDVAIVWLGINDSYSGVSIGNWSTSGNFSANMHEILRALHILNPDMLIYVLGINFSTGLTYDKNKSTYSYNQALKQVANIDGAIFKNLDHLPNAAIQHSAALKSDGNHFKDDYSKTVLFNAILNKILVPASDDYDEVLMIGSGLLTAGTGVNLTKGWGINVIGKFVYLNLLFTAQATATALFTLPDIFDFGNFNFKISDINNPSNVYYGAVSGNTIGRGAVALAGGTYFAEITAVMSENNNLQYV